LLLFTNLAFFSFSGVKITLERVLFSYLSNTQDLAPCLRRLPGFIGPVPPPLLISHI